MDGRMGKPLFLYRHILSMADNKKDSFRAFLKRLLPGKNTEVPLEKEPTNPVPVPVPIPLQANKTRKKKISTAEKAQNAAEKEKEKQEKKAKKDAEKAALAIVKKAEMEAKKTMKQREKEAKKTMKQREKEAKAKPVSSHDSEGKAELAQAEADLKDLMEQLERAKRLAAMKMKEYEAIKNNMPYESENESAATVSNTYAKIKRAKTKTQKKSLEVVREEASKDVTPLDPTTEDKVKQFQEKRAAKTLKKFFKKTEIKRKTLFLNTLCSDAGQCLAFGRETDNIRKFFNNYKFDYLDTSQIKMIGDPSDNGFVNELPYEREGYKTYCILKSSRKPTADNLFYEGFIGIYINKINKLYPCFLETYNLCFYSKDGVYNKLKEKKPVTQAELNDGLIVLKRALNKKGEMDYEKILDSKTVDISCQYPTRMCILIQHLNNVKSLQSYLTSGKTDFDFICVHLVNYLYQLYCPLAMLYETFTHYDFHTKNVVIYKVSENENSYIRMVYVYPNKQTVEFNTFGIAKILDYGRSYFNDKAAGVNSQTLMKVIADAKQTPNCVPSGRNMGYTYLDKEMVKGSQHYITGANKNSTHDLRLANIVHTNINYNLVGSRDRTGKVTLMKKEVEPIKNILTSVYNNYKDVYAVKKGGVDHGYGAPEFLKHEYEKTKKVRNVRDMHVALKQLILGEPYFAEKMNTLFAGKKKMGTMRIYVDGSKPTEYVAEP